jgi:hypothetical protein
VIHVTRHAMQRYCERVCELDGPDIRADLNRKPFICAAEFAGSATVFVHLPTGQRVVICEGSVVTVLPAMSLHRFVHTTQLRGEHQ